MLALVAALFLSASAETARATDDLVIEPVSPSEQAQEEAQSAAEAQNAAGDAADGTATEPGAEPGIAGPGGSAAAGAHDVAAQSSVADREIPGSWDVEYFAIFYGPSLQSPSAYQPTAYGGKDFSHPVVLRNFLGVGYNITDQIAVTPTATWLWNPIGSQSLVLQDPFIRLSDSSLFSTKQMNLYSDVRVFLPLTRLSQDQKMRLGFQTFHAFAYDVPRTPLTLGAYGSARVNFYGDQAFGNDLELYLAPNVNYQFAPDASAIVTYEMNAAHVLGTKAWSLINTGTDLQPGVAWLVTPRLMVNPYFSLNTGGTVSAKSTSIGFSMSYRMI
jgi:hypothetical protein